MHITIIYDQNIYGFNKSLMKNYLVNNIIDKTFQQFPSFRRIQLHKEYSLHVKNINPDYQDNVIGHKFIFINLINNLYKYTKSCSKVSQDLV